MSCSINTVTTAHLAKGSALPPKKEGLLRLYSMLYCPYAERARLILKVKNVPHDIVNVDLKNKPEWLLELNPAGKVPTLDTNSEIIPESLVISDYLDEKYPEPPLYPIDPVAKQKDKELINSFTIPIGKLYEAFYNKENLNLEQRIQNALPEIEKLETELSERGTFLGGESPKMVDYMIWPWAERASVVPLLYNEKVPSVLNERFPRISAWYAAMQKQLVIQEIQTSVEKLYKFILQFKEGGAIDYNGI